MEVWSFDVGLCLLEIEEKDELTQGYKISNIFYLIALDWVLWYSVSQRIFVYKADIGSSLEKIRFIREFRNQRLIVDGII